MSWPFQARLFGEKTMGIKNGLDNTDKREQEILFLRWKK
jgi:hypothetical protein